MFGIISSYDSKCDSCLIIGYKQNGVPTVVTKVFIVVLGIENGKENEQADERREKSNR